jgi:ADYC domain
LATLVVLATSALAAPPSAPPGPSVAVEGTAFRVTLPDGSVLAQERLPGTVLTLGDGSVAQRRIRIDAVEHDTRDLRGEVVLYTLSEPDAATGQWRNACEPDPDGRRLGFPLAGAFTSDGHYVMAPGAAPGRILITCTGGAEGKCIRFGYKPWRSTPDGASLEPYYQACVRLVRADYGGDGVGHTRNGTPIDLFDRIGIQRDESGPGMTLEAAFAPDGAVCVAHPRLPDLASLDALAQRYPRLAGHLGTACGEHAPALLFVRSVGGQPTVSQ